MLPPSLLILKLQGNPCVSSLDPSSRQEFHESLFDALPQLIVRRSIHSKSNDWTGLASCARRKLISIDVTERWKPKPRSLMNLHRNNSWIQNHQRFLMHTFRRSNDGMPSWSNPPIDSSRRKRQSPPRVTIIHTSTFEHSINTSWLKFASWINKKLSNRNYDRNR